MTRPRSRRYAYLALVCAAVAVLLSWRLTLVLVTVGYILYAIAHVVAWCTEWAEGRDVDGVRALARKNRADWKERDGFNPECWSRDLRDLYDRRRDEAGR